jgi:hypothetical protein
MLSSMLNSHPSILCHHELYNPGGIYYALPLRGTEFTLAASIQERDQYPLDFLTRIWSRDLAMPCVGFKMTHKQNPQVFDTLLNDPAIKKIILQRNNQVKVHVSKLIAEQNGIWEDYGQQTRDNSTQVKVDLSRLQQDIAFNRNFYQEITTRLEQSKQRYLKLEYENLTRQDTQQRLFQYLQLDTHVLTTPSRKQNPTDLKHKISNFSTLLTQCQDDELLTQLTDKLT